MLLWELDQSSYVGSSHEQASIVFLPDGKTLAVGGEDNRVRLWDVTTGHLKNTVTLKQQSLPDGSYFYIGTPTEFSPDGKLLVTFDSRGDDNYDLKFWDTQTGRPKWSALSQGNAVAFSPDSRTLATYGTIPRSRKTIETIEIWDVITGQQKRSPIQIDATISVTFSPDGKTLAYVVPSGGVEILNVRTGVKQQKLSARLYGACSVAFSPNGKLLALGSWSGKVVLWDLSKGRRLYTLQGHKPGALGLSALTFSPDSKLLASGGQSEVEIWDMQTGASLNRLEVLATPGKTDGLPVGEVAFSRDGSILAICGKGDPTVTLHRMK